MEVLHGDPNSTFLILNFFHRILVFFILSGTGTGSGLSEKPGREKWFCLGIGTVAERDDPNPCSVFPEV